MGAKKSSGEIILFSDDDTIWDKDYLENILEVFEKKGKIIGGVTGKPINLDKSIKRKIVDLLSRLFCTIFFLTREGNGKFQPSGMATILGERTNKITRCEFLYGFSMAFERKIFLDFLLDENFSGYVWNDDDDLAYRISRNYPIYYTPFAKVLHTMPRRIGKNNYMRMRKMIKHHHYFYKKNLPKTIKYKIAFLLSLIGLFFKNLILSILRKDFSRILGISHGIKDLL